MSKRTERNSSGSSPCQVKPKEKKLKLNTATMEPQETNATRMILDSFETLRVEMNNGLSKIQTDMDILRHDVKVEIQNVKQTVHELEKSMELVWPKVDKLAESLTGQEEDSKALRTEASEPRQTLEMEKAKNLALENYSRRENLRLMNMPEKPEENLRSVVRNIIGQHLYISPLNMRFHAVHCVGRRQQNTDPNSSAARPRPVIIRFLCREDRDDVCRAKGKLKESGNEVYKACYFTADYPPSIRKERAILVRAMLKTQAAGKSAKVINTTLFVDDRKYGVSNVPEELKES